MKILLNISMLALVCLFAACENERTDEPRDIDTTRETRRDADRDTIRIGTEEDDEVEIRITE